ncbi:MAG: (Fe-S)-binding protein [Deltaproteobacteria bacterium]|nr:(Fe-S)-binding protein [Deltaproteobacteria bacterium]
MRVSLFVTCIVDQLYPAVGKATVELLEKLDVRVDYNPEQTCCGQPAFNTGYTEIAASIAKRNLEILAGADYVVVPSGSCASQFRIFYPELFGRSEKAQKLAAKTFELSEFLVKVLKVKGLPSRFNGVVAYHDSCHALRELGIREEPRELLGMVKGLKLMDLPSNTCCGFGGTFSVKFPELSCAMADDKIATLESMKADVVTSTDMGCLMHLEGRLRAQGSRIQALHLAQILVGMK